MADGEYTTRELVLAAQAGMDALRKDAERYRWLRAGNYPLRFARSVLNDTPHGIDSAIDAAMRVGVPGRGEGKR